MKRISTYKMFENKSDILSFVDDCLVDLVHDYFTINKQLSLDDTHLVIYINRGVNYELFHFDRVRDSLIFLISMLSEKDWDILNVGGRWNNRWNIISNRNTFDVNEMLNDFNRDKIQSVSLTFDLNRYKYKFK